MCVEFSHWNSIVMGKIKTFHLFAFLDVSFFRNSIQNVSIIIYDTLSTHELSKDNFTLQRRNKYRRLKGRHAFKIASAFEAQIC